MAYKLVKEKNPAGYGLGGKSFLYHIADEQGNWGEDVKAVYVDGHYVLFAGKFEEVFGVAHDSTSADERLRSKASKLIEILEAKALACAERIARYGGGFD